MTDTLRLFPLFAALIAFWILAPPGITVNAVSPGLTDDSVLQSFGDAAVDIARKWRGSGWAPMGRMGTPGDIGNVVSLLCSPEAAWITGQLI
jgi:NAD(P)-dependent dehydrogenase (short-subunit alcohol dehydrogenase family)